MLNSRIRKSQTSQGLEITFASPSQSEKNLITHAILGNPKKGIILVVGLAAD
jgi:hypothetical protein